MPCHTLQVPFNLYNQTLGELVKELVITAFNIYSFLLSESVVCGPISLVCPGQSPAYFALAMMNLCVYKPNLVEIQVLPHSKGGSTVSSLEEKRDYGKQLLGREIAFRDNIYILDTVHSGAGITAFENTLRYNNVGKYIRLISINHPSSPPFINVYKSFSAVCVPRVSDSFPRIVQHYLPHKFSKEEMQNRFINMEGNEYAEMIEDIASIYKKIDIEKTDWYRLNSFRSI